MNTEKTDAKKEQIAKMLWERFSPEHEDVWPTTHAAEYRLAAEDILNLIHQSQQAKGLTDYWQSFCDADAFPGSDTFLERMERAGFIEAVHVTDDALEDPFAAERGIVPGGHMMVLTAAGREAMQRTSLPSEDQP